MVSVCGLFVCLFVCQVAFVWFVEEVNFVRLGNVGEGGRPPLT